MTAQDDPFFEYLCSTGRLNRSYLRSIDLDRPSDEVLKGLLDEGVTTIHDLAAARATFADSRVATPGFAAMLDGMMANLAGKQLGPYILESKIGQGGQGSVWLARKATGLEEHVAVKVLLPISGSDSVERLRREARVMMAIKSPHVVGYRDFGSSEELTWLAMEFIDGQSTGQRVRDHGPLDHATCQRTLEDVLLGLGVSHDHGILHRDLTANNVLLRDADGDALLTDFGLAKGADYGQTLTSAGSVIGTVAYIAPELYRNEPATVCSDLWSVGILACVLRTGRAPFRGDSISALMHSVCHEAPQLDEMDQLGWFTRQLLHKDPSQRPQSAKAALELLRTGATGPRRSKAKWLAAISTLLALSTVPWWNSPADSTASSELQHDSFQALDRALQGLEDRTESLDTASELRPLRRELSQLRGKSSPAQLSTAEREGLEQRIYHMAAFLDLFGQIQQQAQTGYPSATVEREFERAKKDLPRDYRNTIWEIQSGLTSQRGELKAKLEGSIESMQNGTTIRASKQLHALQASIQANLGLSPEDRLGLAQSLAPMLTLAQLRDQLESLPGDLSQLESWLRTQLLTRSGLQSLEQPENWTKALAELLETTEKSYRQQLDQGLIAGAQQDPTSDPAALRDRYELYRSWAKALGCSEEPNLARQIEAIADNILWVEALRDLYQTPAAQRGVESRNRWLHTIDTWPQSYADAARRHMAEGNRWFRGAWQAVPGTLPALDSSEAEVVVGGKSVWLPTILIHKKSLIRLRLIRASATAKLTKAFYIGEREVSQAEWSRLLPDSNPSPLKGPDLPVHGVSFHQSERFVTALKTSSEARWCLPSVAQWEYACRAGKGRYDQLQDSINCDNRQGGPCSSAQAGVNDWHLLGMLGNVFEWCRDDAEAKPEAGKPALKTLRGGCFHSPPTQCLYDYEFSDPPDSHEDEYGLRIGLELSQA